MVLGIHRRPSINKPVPVNTKREVHVKRLATRCYATVTPVERGPAVEGVLEVEAPLSRITKLELVGDKRYLHLGSRDGLRSARLVPDLASFPDVANDAASELFCVSILAMKRETEQVFHITKKEVQGIVVRRLQGR